MEQNKNVPIIALTAHVLAEDKDKCLAAGMQEVLTKPLERTEIVRVLSSLL
jgi:CheY-like chemotaxis protein